jgi:membrane protein implicated in regulation of membrane protease activity
MEPIPTEGIGKVELRGAPWNAHNDGPRPIASGERCRVERVKGITLWVRPPS